MTALDNEGFFETQEDKKIYAQVKPEKPFEEWQRDRRELLRPAAPQKSSSAPETLLRPASFQHLIAEAALGTCLSPTQLAEKFSVSEEDVEEALADANVEMCSVCEWWCEAGDLVGEDEETAPCRECRRSSE